MTKTYDLMSTSYAESVNKRINELDQNKLIAIPAKVIGTKDYEKYQCLSVEFSIKDIYTRKDAAVLEAVRLEKVFVKLPRFGGWKFKFPVSEGDPVTLHWSQKDLSKFLDGDGSAVEQYHTEVAELEDCWVDLGFGTRKNHNNPHLKNLIMTNGNCTQTITPEGNITLQTKGDIKTISEGTHYIKASHLTIDNSVTINENLLVKGNSTTDGNTTTKGTTTSEGVVNANSGVQAASYAGTGGGAASFNVDMGVNGTVTINGVDINNHTHTESTGGTTGAPQ